MVYDKIMNVMSAIGNRSRMFLRFKMLNRNPINRNPQSGSNMQSKSQEESETTKPIKNILANIPERKKINLTLVYKGEKYPIVAEEDDRMIEVVSELNIKGFGWCGGALNCLTCLITFKPDDYKNLRKQTIWEEEWICYAGHKTATSRCSCQVKLTEAMEGMEVTVPYLDTYDFFKLCVDYSKTKSDDGVKT